MSVLKKLLSIASLFVLLTVPAIADTTTTTDSADQNATISSDTSSSGGSFCVDVIGGGQICGDHLISMDRAGNVYMIDEVPATLAAPYTIRFPGINVGAIESIAPDKVLRETVVAAKGSITLAGTGIAVIDTDGDGKGVFLIHDPYGTITGTAMRTGDSWSLVQSKSPECPYTHYPYRRPYSNTCVSYPYRETISDSDVKTPQEFVLSIEKIFPSPLSYSTAYYYYSTFSSWLSFPLQEGVTYYLSPARYPKVELEPWVGDSYVVKSVTGANVAGLTLLSSERSVTFRFNSTPIPVLNGSPPSYFWTDIPYSTIATTGAGWGLSLPVTFTLYVTTPRIYYYDPLTHQTINIPSETKQLGDFQTSTTVYYRWASKMPEETVITYTVGANAATGSITNTYTVSVDGFGTLGSKTVSAGTLEGDVVSLLSSLYNKAEKLDALMGEKRTEYEVSFNGNENPTVLATGLQGGTLSYSILVKDGKALLFRQLVPLAYQCNFAVSYEVDYGTSSYTTSSIVTVDAYNCSDVSAELLEREIGENILHSTPTALPTVNVTGYSLLSATPFLKGTPKAGGQVLGEVDLTDDEIQLLSQFKDFVAESLKSFSSALPQ